VLSNLPAAELDRLVIGTGGFNRLTNAGDLVGQCRGWM
jgi:hypothetical protein